jgi:hypothetical protein
VYWIQLVYNKRQWQKAVKMVNGFQRAQNFLTKLAIIKFLEKPCIVEVLCVCIHTHKYVTTQRTIILILTNESWWQGFNTCNGRICFLPPCPSQTHSPSNLLLKAFALTDKAAGALTSIQDQD